MTLKSLMTSDVSDVFLNANDFAESVVRDPCGAAQTLTVVWFERDELDYVRYGDMYASSSETILDGSLWRIRGEMWRAMHTDQAEEGMRRTALHKQLPSLVNVRDRNWIKTEGGAQDDNSADVAADWEYEEQRALIHEVDAEEELDRGDRRTIVPSYRIFFEANLPLNHNHVVMDMATGNHYRIVGRNPPEQFERLMYCEAEAWQE